MSTDVTIIPSHIEAVLEFVQPYLPINPVIVEAGAFKGAGTVKLAEKWPKGTVHAFEPVPQIFRELQNYSGLYYNVKRYACALSDSCGMAEFHVSEKPTRPGEPSQGGSLLKPKERLKWSNLEYKKTMQVPTMTLDYWAEKYKIEEIDFLWLDMQGCELNVMKAAPNMLAKVKVIYTEVEFVEAYEGQYQYGDVRSWLESQGFTMIAKDFTNQKDWFFGNCVFANKKFKTNE